MIWERLWTLRAALAAVLLSAGVVGGMAQAQDTGHHQETGYEVNRPVFGGACLSCPWGALGEIVQAAMASTPYDVQMCYTCGGGPQEVRLVAAASLPPPVTPQVLARMAALHIPPLPAPPNGPVDFGATTTNLLTWAYRGTHDFAREGPRTNLRIVATIPSPIYLVVAATKKSGITDLAQLQTRHGPLRVLTDFAVWKDGPSDKVLAYYGLSKERVEAGGGELLNGLFPTERQGVDVVIYMGTLSGSPEFNALYELTQTHELTFLQLPDALLSDLSSEFDMERHPLPAGEFRGVDRPIPTVGWLGNVIYGRTDMPDAFAYDLARALDNRQDLLAWASEHFSYNTHNVWKCAEVPLHPGAERYYREMGYIK